MEKQSLAVADEAVQTETLPYSVFSNTQKKWIIFIAALAGWFSTASSFIYFPAIPFLGRDTGASTESINLTITSYLIASGIFPSITGDAADRYGRRPVFVVSLCAYALVNVGLAVQKSFACLFVLRMIQSATISGMIVQSCCMKKLSFLGTFSIAYGIISDLTTPNDRGGYTGFVSLLYEIFETFYSCYLLTLFHSLNTPPSIAPLISGLLLIRWSWPSIFWFLTIASATVLLAIMIFMPETCRSIVGNGTLRPPLINQPPISSLSPSIQRLETEQNPKMDLGLPNPLSVLSLLKNKATLVAVGCYSIYYTIYSCLQASLSTVFVETYNISGRTAGLSYIPFGLACVASAFLAGNI